ncbi:hypothetical protein BCR34DRAFT_666914 [Clohesyomyces aquaticus]|uniref:5'-3' DNA helicase ZGRF1-like N-terminal domain-containing protein n=1 Tax=Clohesyomyces aquaticus TaxID=1231657 RepID=A0A1Y1Z4H2_9PLEO|nr:hypothetical protein BCR34DRAFT_666914 [Clohesyomyces aquaticus]
MTAPVRGTPRLSGIPASQNTAPVAEFRCLFTHDMRRKQKRWQDGFLKFHSFNSRVMVYDATRNFLGDTYWKESPEIGEGDELTLDKGVMVEVAEAMEVTQTDLTPLFEKKPKQSPQGKSAAAASPVVRPSPAVPPPVAGRNSSQLRHKSLNTLLGTPKGPLGKAVPLRSPYEARKEKEKDWTDGRAAKRRKIGQEVMPLISSSPVESGQPPPARNLPLWARTADAKKIAPPHRPIPHGAAVISLDSEPDHVASDITLSSTLPRGKNPRPASTSMPAPAVQTALQPPKGKIRLPQSKPKQTPQPPPRSSSPPVSVSNRVSNIAFALETATKPVEEVPRPQSPPREPKAKLLRLSKGNKRGTMLMCQSLPQELVAPRTEVVKERRRKSKDKDRDDTTPFESIPFPSDDDVPAVPRKTLMELDGKRKSGPASKEAPPAKKARAAEQSSQSSSDAFEDMTVVHGLMDRRLIVSDESARAEKRMKSRAPPAPRSVKAKLASKRSPQKPRQGREDSPQCVPVPRATKSKQDPTNRTSEEGDNSPIIKPAPRPKKITKLNPPPFKIPPPGPQAAQPLHSPTSPLKPALLTSRFCKKSKRTNPSNTDPSPAPIPHKHTTPVLPTPIAHTPTAPSTRAPLKPPPLDRISTTELSLLHDPIEDLSQAPKPPIATTTLVSPNRSFRRVRSENDAPIPSTSADWEKRNLPNPKSRPAQEQVGGGAEPVKSAATVGLKLGPGLGALVKQTDPRRKFVRTQSLNVDTRVGGARGGESVSPVLSSPVVDTDVGPWSTEAFDLFDWRPPRKEGDEGEGYGFGMLVDR